MQKKILCAAAVLAPLLGQAQQFTPGYLVRANRDTVRGEIENGFWEEAPATLRFRPAPSAAVQQVATNQLQGFGFPGGRAWRAQILTYDAAAESRRNYVQRDAPRTRLATDTLLVEVLLDGPLSLVAAFRSTSPHYFVQQAGRPPLELVQRYYLRTDATGRPQLSAVNNYRDQLRLYLQPQCPAVETQLTRLSFEAEQLRQFLGTYGATCLGLGTVSAPLATGQPRVGTFRVEVGVLAGGAYTTGRFASAASATLLEAPIAAQPGQTINTAELERPYLEGQQLEQNVQPLAGAYLDLLFPGRRFALHLEGQVRQRAATAFTIDTKQADYPTKTYSFKQQLVPTAMLGFRVLFPVGAGQVLGGAGLAAALNSALTPTIAYPNGMNRRFRGQSLPDVRRLQASTSEAGPYLEGGYRWGRLTGSVSWRYFTRFVNDNSTISSVLYNNADNAVLGLNTYRYNYQTHQVQLNLAYRLNRNTDQ